MPDWTKEQKQAIEEKGSNILVAAAAGSGKTTVLVERIIQKIINQKVDIDRMLIVTFTNAAASEMRDKILQALYKKIDENPENMHLQKQIVLLNKASICTIDSFCLDVIKNNFFNIGISSNFRIADNTELELMKQEAIEDLFEELYEKKNEKFIKLTELYAGYRGDEDLKSIILKIYNTIQSNPFPEEWLKEKIEDFNVIDKKDTDFSESIWGKILINNYKDELIDEISNLKVIKGKLDRYRELEKYSMIIGTDIDMLNEILNHCNTWNDALICSMSAKFKTWSADKKVTMPLKDEAKVARDVIKDKFNKATKSTFLYNSEEAYEDIYSMYDVLVSLGDLVNKFTSIFEKNKKEKNIMDFSDVEHSALKILLQKDEDGNYIKTDVAKKLQEKYEEIAIDEYQDSNLVQEYILTAISNNKNIFMVGDVKQSIYKFRQARPELFLEKYESYGAKKQDNNGLKIQLFKNFRSRKSVLDITNLIFDNIMSKSLGDIDYTKNEYLNYGANFEELEESEELNDNKTDRIDEKNECDNIKIKDKYNNRNNKAELHIIDLKENIDEIDVDDENENNKDDEQYGNEKNQYDNTENDVNKDKRKLEKTEIEAKYVANEIKRLIDSKYQIYDRKVGFRNIKYKDIVILLRATSNIANVFEKELYDNGIPVFSDTGDAYLETLEIEQIISLLKVIDNPYQDIPLMTVLRSPICDFSDDELTKIRLVDRNSYFYNTLEKILEVSLENRKLENSKKENTANNGLDKQNEIVNYNIEESTINKVKKFIDNVCKWREEEKYLKLNELIWQIYMDTGFYSYVGLTKNGAVKQANLKMLFEKAKDYENISFKGLFNFIRYIEKIKKSTSDFMSAKIIGENEDVVRIMSIHKSKGLEFPVVFLSRSDKQINLRDLNDSVLLDQDLGIGPKYINYERKIEYNTAAREAIKLKSRTEAISEEMRVLYVALTRAKEKLIITGVRNDYSKELEKKKELLNIYENENNKINHLLIQKYTSYLDWIELVALNNENINEFLDIKVINNKEEDGNLSSELETSEKENIIEDNINNLKNERLKFKRDADLKEINLVLNWKYKNIVDTKIPSKTSVSKIKELKFAKKHEKDKVAIKEDENISEEIEYISEENTKAIKKEEVLEIKPEFMKDNAITSAQIGTLMHLCLQKLELKRMYSTEELNEFIEKLVYNKLLTDEEKKWINVNKIKEFMNSNLAKKIRNAKIIEKEKPFYTYVKAKDIYEEDSDENILVQGIIDLYFIDEMNNAILVDYKTDYVTDEAILIDRYKVQLDLYKKALEESLNKKVDKVYIYSVYLSKEIEVKIK